MKMTPMNQSPNQLSNKLLTPTDVSALLSVSLHTVYYWVERNEIPFIRVGRHLRFVSDEVLNFFRRRTEDSKPSCLKGQLFATPKPELRSLKTRNANPTPALE